MRHPIVTEDLKEIAASNLPFEELAGKTILVTGANGFLPAYLVEFFLYLNETRSGPKTQVLCLVRNKEKAASRFSHYQGRSDLNFIVQDVCDPVSIPGPVDYIIHAASHASPKFYGKDPVGTLLPNVLGTHHLLELARKKSVKGFLFFSSAETYGEINPLNIPTEETIYGLVNQMDIRSSYAESKRMGETMCMAWSAQYGVPIKIVRPFHTYGPGLPLSDGRVFSDFIGNIVEGRDIIMKSDGSASRAYCYLADATSGFLTVLLKGKNGEAYNVGNPSAEVSVLTLAKTLVTLFPEKNLEVLQTEVTRTGDYIPSKVSRTAPDISKLNELGWKPHWSLTDGFRRTVLSFL